MERAVSRGTVMKTDWTCQQTLGTSSPQTQTLKLRIFKAVNVCLCVRSRKLVHVYASSVSLPLPTILQRYHLPPSLSSSQQLFLPVHSIPAPLCQPLYCTTVLFKVPYYMIKMFIFCVCLFFMYFLCEKYYRPITVQYYIADCVGWVPRLRFEQIGLNEHALGRELVCV